MSVERQLQKALRDELDGLRDPTPSRAVIVRARRGRFLTLAVAIMSVASVGVASALILPDLWGPADRSDRPPASDGDDQSANVALERDIVFTTSNGEGDTDISIGSRDGSGVGTLVATPRQEYSPTWSPDGQRVAFVSLDDQDRYAHIFVVDADGTNLTQVTSGEVTDRGPAWSPDGELIAFGRALPNGDADIYTVAPDGSGLSPATNGEGYESSPAWSPDGQQIAYEVSGSTVEGSQIRIVKRSGGADRVVTSGSGHYGAPAWSPDGSSLAATLLAPDDSPDPSLDIVVLDLASGQTSTVLEDAGMIVNDLAWTPDATAIGFASVADRASKPDGLRIVAVADGTVTDLPYRAGPSAGW